ncbi:hypothetical protein PQX77_003290 [Marasmius sp. AFHP31]|nr:hypothetical protein PQX77_003290 [Marasmius sp. AFHP31]
MALGAGGYHGSAELPNSSELIPSPLISENAPGWTIKSSEVGTSTTTGFPATPSAIPDNPTATTTQTVTPVTPLPLSTTFDTPIVATREAVNRSPIIIGVVVGGTVSLILAAVVVIVIVRRNRGRPHRQAGWFTTGFRRRRRERQNLKVTALPIATPGPEHVAEKTRERRHQVDSPGPTVTDDQRVPGPAVDGQSGGTDSEMLAKLNMLIERAARSSPGPAVDGQSRGMDLEVLAKLDMIMEKVARLEEDRGREEEAPPDYVSNRS